MYTHLQDVETLREMYEATILAHTALVGQVDEYANSRFTTEHFGFLTPDEAKERYKSEYSARFDAYFGRALGVFLQELPPRYRQQ